MKVVIFAGGVGTRLWPLSRKNSPKQFGKIVGDKSTLQLAVERVLPISSFQDIYISTGKQYFEIIKKQLPELPEENIIIEPEMRDVGPAIGLVTAILTKIDPKEPIALLWSDHLMKREEAFRQALESGAKILSKDPNKLVLICQKPRFAAQNLGWAEFGEKVDEVEGTSFFEFKGFQYRPSLDVAQQFFKDGQHAWNLGYFVTTPEYLWSLYEEHVPDLFSNLKEIQDKFGTKDYEETLNRIYPKIEKIHFDNAILERVDHSSVYVISADLGWSDVGAWEQLKEALSENIEDNAILGNVITEDSKDNLIFNYTEQLVVGIDLEEMLVINTGDVLLVCPKNSVPKIKKFVESLSGTDKEKYT